MCSVHGGGSCIWRHERNRHSSTLCRICQAPITILSKKDFEDVLDADLVHVLAENNDEIQGVLENLYEETLKSVN